MPLLPQTNINGFGYWINRNNAFLGMSSVDLSKIEYLTETLKGFGRSGETTVPVLGHVGSMEATIHFHAPTPDVYRLAAPEIQHIEIRSEVQHQDKLTGKVAPILDRYVLKITPKGLNLGSIKVAEGQGVEIEIVVYSITSYHNDQRIMMIDPDNMVCEFDGVDHLKKVRSDLGIS